MRLPIISLAVFVVCFGLFGCTNARSSMPASLSEKQNNSTNVLLILTDSSKILTSQYSTKNVKISEYQIEDHSKIAEIYPSVQAFTSTCLDNIYILQNNDPFSKKQVLDVIRYNKNNGFERINRVKDMFDNAISIASDYTGKIYWIDNANDSKYSIKVTDKSFKKQKYIIYPTRKPMSDLQVHPKRSKLFFLSEDSLWYTSKSLHSTPHKLFSSDVKFQGIYRFTIDYVTDKLCWIHSSYDRSLIYCVFIGTFDRPLDAKDLVIIEKAPELYINDLVSFNNTFYWTAVSKDYMFKLYYKNNKEPAVVKADLQEHGYLAIVSSICSYNCCMPMMDMKQLLN